MATVAAELQEHWGTRSDLLDRLATTDHKIIGKRYLVTAFVFLAVGGLEALLMRWQLAGPGRDVLSAEAYNQLFSMHGTTMIFWYAAPILSGFSNYLFPLMLGSRDMAYPRLNALSYWVFLFSGIFLYSSFLVGAAPDGGWFAYVPLTSAQYSPGPNMDFYTLALIFLTVSTTVGAINFIVTAFKLRAPGMSVARWPIFIWGTVTVSFVNLAALPPLSVAAAFLWLERNLGMHFFDPLVGGQPLLWQHLFWIFGHPWVYVVVLPAMSIVSTVLPVFSRRRLVGYLYVALATVATGILGFGVWVHHMFATGIPELSMGFFSAASFVIAVPSAVSVFAWLATLWHGRPVIRTPMLFMLGFVVLFVLGGVSGVATAAIPFDWQLTDSYFVVAHLHYVLLGINVFPVIGALHHWLPKITGRMLDRRLGRWTFWVMFVGFNVAFFPMHVTGLLGMPRRVFTYEAGLGWGGWNLVSTVGALVLAAGIGLFVWNFLRSLRRGEAAGSNPWNAGTLEWATASPPPPYNFERLPTVASRNPLWEAEDDRERSDLEAGPPLEEDHRVLEVDALDGTDARVRDMPGHSLWPFLAGVSLLVLFYGLLTVSAPLAAAGGLALAGCVSGWLWPSGGGGPTEPASRTPEVRGRPA